MFKKLAIVTALLLAGCQGRTEFGECVGVQDLDEARHQHPELEYRLSTRNTVLGIIFFQTIFAPVIWLAADFECPVAKK